MDNEMKSVRLFDADRAVSLMEAEGIDLVLAHSRRNAGYLTDHYWEFLKYSSILDNQQFASFVGLPGDSSKEPFYVGSADQCQAEHNNLWIKNRRFAGWNPTADKIVPLVAEAIRELGLEKSTIGIEFAWMPAGIYNFLRQILPNVSFVEAGPLLQTLRMIKHPKEVELIRKAVEIADNAVEKTFNSIREGMTGFELEHVLKSAIGSQGGQVNYIALGCEPCKDGQNPEFVTETPIRKGFVFSLDIGVSYRGYCSDIRRTASFGEPSNETVNFYNLCRKAQEACFEALKIGIPVSQINHAAQKAFIDTGLKSHPNVRSAFLESHGIGLSVHEAPQAAVNGEVEMTPGMTIAVEAIAHVPNVAIIGLEDDLLINENGFEFLSKSNRNLYIID